MPGASSGWGERKGFLLLASYAFYAAWNPPFVVLLFGTSPPSTRLPGPSTGVGNR
ncbi:MAG TPA: hypothetical protein QGF58_14205 [Myxococcota bacterium]|nr:hypothetical protein [Myxococcota bacterium]